MPNSFHILGNEVLGVAQMYAADAAAVASGIQSLSLMELAGMSCAREIRQQFSRCRTAILCGPGNNGGDGFVIARYLQRAGWPIKVGLLGKIEDLKGDAATNAKRWQEDGGEINPLSTDLLVWSNLVVDALFGAGLVRPLQGPARSLVLALLDSGLQCVAIDMPSGVSGDTGEILGGDAGTATRCDLTITFFRHKPGHLLCPGRDLCGRVVVADIGIPETVLKGIRPNTTVIGYRLANRIPTPGPADHKYTRGHVLLFGSIAMSGAIRLGAAAARRIGAGLVTVVAPQDSAATYRQGAPGLIFEALELDEPTTRVLADSRQNVVLIGPGLGVGEVTRERVIDVLATDRAVVVDADGLTSFADNPDALFEAIRSSPGEVVLTPHNGEFVKLFGLDGDSNRLSQCRAAAAKSGAIVLLKGSDTVIACTDGTAAILAKAPGWLATAGSGDVLAGIIAGLLAQGFDAWFAACTGASVHGAAANLAGPGLIAEDIIENISGVLG
ncbi:MAG: NAD(P)H-hydrate dehydratase [Rhodospirillaceae bacterium]